MRTVFRILKMDLRNITRSFPVFITILVFCLLPACYAVISIKASWDPYSAANTSRLPIAVINNDEGSSVNGKNINIGGQIIGELRKNKSMNWIVIDEWQGNYGLNAGKYYSLIEIPADFSRKLLSVTTSHPEKPNIVYRSNEKLNPAATKITNTAKNSLTDEIKSSFIKISSKEVLEQLNSIGIKLNKDKPKILELKSTLEDAISTIDDVKKYLSRVRENSREMGTYLGRVKDDVPRLSDEVRSLKDVLKQEKSIVQSAKQAVNSAQGDLAEGVNEIQSLNSQAQSLLSSIENHAVGNDVLKDIDDAEESAIERINGNIKVINAMNGFLPDNVTGNLIGIFTKMKNSIEVERGYISYMRQLLENNAPDESINSVLNQLTVTANDISSYLNEVQPLNSMGSSIDDNLKNYDNMLQSMGTVASQLDSLADAGTLINQASVRQIDQMSKRVGDIESKLNDLDIKMKTVNEKSLDNIIGIMEKNPDQISDLLSSPVELKNVQLYNLGLFGYAVTPFYTTLSIWVGVLLFRIILTLKYKKSDVGIKLNMAHRYFGKLLLFIILSFIQTLIVLFGEFFILGIRPESEITMVIVALTTSIAFTSIIFTLIFTFGNFGKGISAIIMILQLFSTGGIYPIEIISSRLAALAPFLPFTYSIGGLREAMAGPNWTNLSKSLMILFFFAAGFLLLVPIKKIFHKPISRMESEFQRSGL